MKITFEIADNLIDQAFEAPHSRFWCSELVWSETLRRGTCVERNGGPRGGKVRHTIMGAEVERAIQLMLTEGRHEIADVLRGDTDGPCRDVFLQYCVFGKLVYG